MASSRMTSPRPQAPAAHLRRLYHVASLVWGGLATAGALGCSGAPGPAEPRFAALPIWASVDAGAAATCGISTEGRGYCWGEHWATGRPGASDSAVAAPRELPGGRDWAVIEVGLQIACGLTRGGETYCWGKDRLTGLDTLPARLSGDPGLVSITVGQSHACGLTRDEVAYCWGDDFRGQTGAGRSAERVTPRKAATLVAGSLRFMALRAGPESTCGLVAPGDLYCWGGSSVGGEAIEPRRVQQGFAFASLAYGGSLGGRGLVCAPTGAGVLYCFGYQPHVGLSQPSPSSVVIPGAPPARQVVVGGVWTPEINLSYAFEAHACAIDMVGGVSCWGSNGYGQLGDGTTVERTAAAAVPRLTGVTQVTAGGAHSCAVTTGGAAHCWGANNRGQLGAGKSSSSETTPQQVALPQL
jgi:alpha-tubulin suppressor-like RCC1 family protein